MNPIPELQNGKESLQLLAAQRRLYGRAKWVWGAQVAFVVILPAAFLLVNLISPIPKHFTGLISLIIAVLDSLLFERVKKAFRKHAASVQESFDCRLFNFEWSSLKGSRPDVEDITTLAQGVDPTPLLNWYPPELGELPLYAGRTIAQRSNCRWDSKLRCYFSRFLFGAAGVLLLISTLVAYGKNLTFADLIIGVLAPALPVTLWCIREAYAQKDAADRADRLKKFGEGVWDDAKAGRATEESAKMKARMYQDEIYDHRVSSPVVPDWFYQIWKNTFETQMKYSAEQMVKDFKQAREGRSQRETTEGNRS